MLFLKNAALTDDVTEMLRNKKDQKDINSKHVKLMW